MSATTSPETPPDTKPWACVSCAQRKVKCDRLTPTCSNCVSKNRDCEYKAPAPPNRKKRKTEQTLEQRMLTRITEYEKTLANLQVPFEPFVLTEHRNAGELEPSVARRPIDSDILSRADEKLENGSLWETGAESQRYYSHGLLVKLAEEFKEGLRIEPEALEDAMSRTDDSSMSPPSLIESSSAGVAIDLCSPPQVQTGAELIPEGLLMTLVSKLWPIYLDNVHPLTMIVHAPSLRSLIDKVTVRSITITKTIECLFSAVCACALTSLTSSECEQIFSTDQDLLIRQFHTMASRRLKESGFYDMPSLVSLQAYSLLILSLQGKVPCHTFSMLTSLAIRAAAGLGIHREGSKLQAPPFETELRRRLWWFLVCTDSRAVELSGLSSQILPSFDSQLPLNLDDADLVPGMRTVPVARSGATDMIYVLARYEVLKVQIRLSKVRQVGIALKPGDLNFDTEIDKLEGRLEGHYLRFCEPVVPLHTMTTAIARLWLCKMRVLWTDHLKDGMTLSTAESNKKMRIIEYDNLLMTSKHTQRFVWFITNQFPWGALLQLLDLLWRSCPLPPEKEKDGEKIWALARESFDNRPELIDLNPSKPAAVPRTLQLGLAYTAVKAWEARASVTHEPIEAAPVALQEPLRQRAAGQPIVYDPTGSTRSRNRGSQAPPSGADIRPLRMSQSKSQSQSQTAGSSPTDANAELQSLLNAPVADFHDVWFDNAYNWDALDKATFGPPGGGSAGMAGSTNMALTDNMAVPGTTQGQQQPQQGNMVMDNVGTMGMGFGMGLGMGTGSGMNLNSMANMGSMVNWDAFAQGMDNFDFSLDDANGNRF